MKTTDLTESWIETHFEMSHLIWDARTMPAYDGKLNDSMYCMELAQKFTDKFESENINTDWEQVDWIDTVCEFCEAELNKISSYESN